MKTKKLLSILLALMMMLSVVPMYASAADPIALTEANVVTWPTIEGEMYYGQKLSEGSLTIQGGTVTIDGTTEGTPVEGYFEFVDLEYRPTALNNGASLRFVPEDSENYTGFETHESTKAIYKVLKATPILVDPINNPPVATKVSEAGKRLMTTTISGGALMNPYTKEVIEDAVWGWVKKTTKVNESGYFTATSTPVNYNTISMDIYVGIEGDSEETTVTVAPTFDGEIFYAPDLTWGDLTLVGGSAVIKSTNTPIDGTFTVTETMKDKQVKIGENTIDVKFTPADETLAMASICQVSVTVNPAPIKFVDENGADVVPEITVPYGTTFSSGDDICIALKNYLNIPSGISKNVYVLDDEGNILDHKTVAPVGTKEYKVIARTDNKNYEEAVLTFKLTVEPIVVEINGAGYSSATNELYAYIGKTNIPGTFDIFVDDELVGDDLALTYDTVTCPWTPTETGEHTIKVVYNAVNENYVIADYEKAFTAKVQRTLTYDGYIMLSVGFRENATTAVMGDLVTIKPVLEDFGVWVITDANGNEVTLEGVDLTSKEITFSMPDHDVKISFKTNTQLEQEEAAANCDHICHSDNPLFQMLWKVLTFIFRLFDVQQYCDCGNLHYDAPLFG